MEIITMMTHVAATMGKRGEGQGRGRLTSGHSLCTRRTTRGKLDAAGCSAPSAIVRAAPRLVEKLAAPSRATGAGDLDVFDRELVVVR